MTGPAVGTRPRAQLFHGALAAVSILLLNAAFVSSSLGLLHKPRKVLETDHYRYIAMAQGPGNEDPLARTAPFCWRVLTPFAVFILTKAGLNIHVAFYLTTNLFLFAFLFTLYLYLKDLGHGTGVAIVGLALVGLLQGAVRWYEYQYWMTDPLALFLLVLAFYLVGRGELRLLALVSVLGVMARESYVLVFPYFLLRELRTADPRNAVPRTLAIAGVPLAVLWLLQALIVPVNPHGVLATAARATAFRTRHLLDNQLYLVTIGSFGVLFPLALLFPRRLWDGCKRRYEEAAFVVLVYLSLALASNTERLLAYALPVVVPAALRGLEELKSRARLPLAVASAMALGPQALLYARTRYLGELGASIYQPADWIVAAAMVAFWAACEALLARSGAGSGPSGSGRVALESGS